MKIKSMLLCAASSVVLMACAGTSQVVSEPTVTAKPMAAKVNQAALDSVVSARSDKDKARDKYRKPAETIEFFRIEPGMTVAEALPGGGWYSKILANYLGSNGALYGVNYADDMWERFGFFKPEQIQERIASSAKFPEKVAEFTDNGMMSKGFTLGNVPADVKGTVDRVLFIRALHNLNRFEADAGKMSEAVSAAKMMLKSNGMVGVVQHRLPESATTKTDGSRGYLKQSDVIKAFENAGFELVAQSEMHANPKDMPSAEDIVWRLPPSLSGSRDDEAKKAAMMAIGESDRMTLLFRKR